ncbi:hypothetical protein CERZMDRAFT_89944 [Cercospora zeae-maydis SCOH1-5]|uniref:Uncharacterized protein n=1 Tax=Cercospora zeae-maydis SCOH1-5 TaxID=717836 RepID=A0A6A6FQH1_9PEZI|nr:hypothetical protein CERZMDRAFT_89944 [Cercospora zeae-maydis SCOH1-5]
MYYSIAHDSRTPVPAHASRLARSREQNVRPLALKLGPEEPVCVHVEQRPLKAAVFIR